MKKPAVRRPKLTPVKVEKSIRIGKREKAILRDLSRFRFLTTDQIFLLHFPKGSKQVCYKRLRFLFHKPHCLVQRHVLPLEWGKGSAKLVYSLTKKGSEYAQSNEPGSAVSAKKAYKMKIRTVSYRKHEIAINDVRIAVELAVKQRGWTLTKWISDTVFKNPRILSEMRVVDPNSGSAIPVAPDGFFSVQLSSDRHALFFLELDRGTMESRRFKFKKIRGYHLFGEKWRNVSLFREYKDLDITYRVLTVVDGGEQRTQNLKTKSAEGEFLEDTEHVLKSRRFYFTELKRVAPESIFTDPIWLIPFQSKSTLERFPLFDNL